ncbi:glycine cleavage system protein GcvH, partial [Acinetobacter baumannii]|uniref:glycine cleavage system protein GcvH n=1 Tax=Acinetobacter baumannii TaxID=470 RepID=UPI001F58B067
MNHPSELKYARTHEWVKIEGDLVITGITDHAQDELGDLVYVETPEVGSQVTAGEQAGVVESVKTASDIHAPVSGTVVEVNTDLEDDPDFVNEDPYGKGWIYKIKPDNIADVEKLLTNAEYEAGANSNMRCDSF